jgi:hypothetical protein
LDSSLHREFVFEALAVAPDGGHCECPSGGVASKWKLLDAEMPRYSEDANPAPRRAQSLRRSVGSSDGANADAMNTEGGPDFL